jgi:hypothetical protein
MGVRLKNHGCGWINAKNLPAEARAYEGGRRCTCSATTVDGEVGRPSPRKLGNDMFEDLPMHRWPA